MSRRYLAGQGDLIGQPGSPGGPESAAESSLQDSGVSRKKLYDQNLSDWSARFRKNKIHLDNLGKECDVLRGEVKLHQGEVDARADQLRNLDNKFDVEVNARYQDSKSNFEVAMQQKGMLQVQLSENRKAKASFTREKKMLTSDYERKHAELMRTIEVRDKLEAQLSQLTQQLSQLTGDRRRMERELDEVQSTLRSNTDLADEVNSEIAHVRDGIKDSVELHMSPQDRIQSARGGSAQNSVSVGLEKSAYVNGSAGKALPMQAMAP